VVVDPPRRDTEPATTIAGNAGSAQGRANRKWRDGHRAEYNAYMRAYRARQRAA